MKRLRSRAALFALAGLTALLALVPLFAADDIQLNVSTTTGDKIRAVQKVSGAKAQSTVIDIGVGTAESLVSSTNGLPTTPAGNVASGAADSGNPVKVGGIYNASPITLTNGQRGDAQLDANGYLNVHVAAGSSGNAAASATGSAVPGSAGYAGVNVAGNLRGQTGVNPSGSIFAAQVDTASINGTTVSTGNGVAGAGCQRVTIASDNTAFNVAIASGNVGLVPVTTGGTLPYSLVGTASTNATSVKGSAGQVYSYQVFNTNASSFRFFKLYDKATAPTVGTDTPVLVIGIPPNGGANLAFPNGVQFATGIAFAITTGIANSDTGAINATEVVVNATYK